MRAATSDSMAVKAVPVATMSAEMAVFSASRAFTRASNLARSAFVGLPPSGSG